jgi:hypothetical protein
MRYVPIKVGVAALTFVALLDLLLLVYTYQPASEPFGQYLGRVVATRSALRPDVRGPAPVSRDGGGHTFR